MGMINMLYWEEENYPWDKSFLGIVGISGSKAEVEARNESFWENENNLMVLCWYLPWTQQILTTSIYVKYKIS